ncbi:MAG TPA: hypothetical protein VMN60_02555 [Longimicrobiales bacterium]|nr:hypothetical protein [Longimicrobiales bacterium]
MRFFGIRVLRNTPGELWAALDEAETVVLTADGKPRGIILATSEADFEDTLEVLRRVRFQLALERAWAAARESGAEQISDTEIEKEIAAVRRARARRAS